MGCPRLLFVSGSFLGLSALLLSLGACGGGAPATPVGPAPSYALTAAALNPGSVTAGSASTSTITVTPANGYTGSVSLSCSMHQRWHPGSQLLLQHVSGDDQRRQLQALPR